MELTGTLDGTEVHQLVLEGLFAKCKRVTTTAKLIEQQHLSNLHIRCLVLDHPRSKRTRMEYQEESSWLAVDSARNKFITNLVHAQDGNTLVLCRFIVQLDHYMYELDQSEMMIEKCLWYMVVLIRKIAIT